jgi:hypothetical protein
MQIDGSGRVHLVQSMPVLRPDEQVLQMMVDGWRKPAAVSQPPVRDHRATAALCAAVLGPRQRGSVELDADGGRGVLR